MNVEKIREEVQLIRGCASDAERAHELEDALMLTFIKHVEEAGSPELQEMAREILKTEDIEFPRWCA